MFSERIEMALRFAALAHGDQRRKGSALPYFYHPFSVALILMRFGFPEDWLVAGILHDTIEDTATTAADIEQAFGRPVRELVEGCSEPDQAQRSWEDRKGRTIEFLRTAPYPVKVIACADKLHNLGSVRFDLQHGNASTEEVWARYRRGKEKQAWYYRGVSASLEQNLEPHQEHEIFDSLRTLVHEVFGDAQV